MGDWSQHAAVIQVENPEYLRPGDVVEVKRTHELFSIIQIYELKPLGQVLFVLRGTEYDWEEVTRESQPLKNGDEIIVQANALG